MAISKGSQITQADIVSWITVINKTLQRYGATQLSTSVTKGSLAKAQLIQSAVTGLLVADKSTYNTKRNQNTTVINNSNVNPGDLIEAVDVTNLQTAATTMYNSYCSCDCNYCSCDCDYCSCDCDYCRCDCDYCRCDCNYCNCDCNYCSCDTDCPSYCSCDYECRTNQDTCWMYGGL